MNYDVVKTEFLYQGFTEAFSLGYEGNKKVRQMSPNLPFRVGNPIILWNKVMKEVKLQRFAGPFSEIPFQHFIQSSIGLVLKDHGNDT